ncbi:MAG: hypothetical protein ABSH13_02885 [Candidatus Acidiferrum sp.]|jgi:hypothetical protein
MRLPEKLHWSFDRLVKQGVLIASAGYVFAAVIVTVVPCHAQQGAPPNASDSRAKANVERLSLEDAIERARRNDPQYQSAQTDVGIAREDRVQARDGLLPGVAYNNSEIYTQANRGPVGVVFIANDAVHE